MRILHTADIHLDASYARALLPPAAGARRRQGLRDVFQRILDRAAAWPADAVLIAGDLFDLRHVTRESVAILREGFEQLRPIPVFIAPGNRDPWTPDSPYTLEAWPANVFIFSEPGWTSHALAGLPLTVHGLAATGEDSAADSADGPFAGLEIPSDGRVHVALAHASAAELLPEGQRPWRRFELADIPAGLHYLALGHVHAPASGAAPDGAPAHYPGAPEQHDYAHPEPGHALEIEITQDGGDGPSAATVTPFPAAGAVFQQVSIDCSGHKTLAALERAVRKTANAADGRPRIARVRLEGACGASIRSELGGLHSRLASDFAWLDLEDATEPAEDFEDIARETTSLGLFVQRMNEQIADSASDAERARLGRVRDLGLAAYRVQELPLRGMEGALE